MRILALLAASILGGCSCSGNMIEVENGKIVDIQFRGAHYDEDCGAKRGCRNVYTPDIWYLDFRADKGHNDALKINHPPWQWQTLNSRISVTWEANCSFGYKSWRWTDLSAIE